MAVPAFQVEVKSSGAGADVSLDLGELQKRRIPGTESEENNDFLRRVRARIINMGAVEHHMSYRTIVKEMFDEDVEETDPFEQLLFALTGLFQPKRTLRPLPPGATSISNRKVDLSAPAVKIHVSLGRVFNVPLRTGHHEAGPVPFTSHSTVGSFPMSPQTYMQSGGVGGFGYGMQTPYGGQMQYGMPGTSGMQYGGLQGTSGIFGSGFQFGAVEKPPPRDALPAVVIELSIRSLDGKLETCRSVRASPSTDPDISQVLELPLKAESKEELNFETLSEYGGDLRVSIFDEQVTRNEQQPGTTLSRRHCRFLGSFTLPFSTMYENKCAPIRGVYRVEKPPLIIGYRPTNPEQRSDRSAAAVSTEAAARTLSEDSKEARSSEAEAMYVSLGVSVDPMLAPPESTRPQISRGFESSVVLKHAERWLDGFKSRKDLKVFALGVDIDGRSRLICRYIRPQMPPDHIDPSGPFAIEAAVRYVSLIPFLSDRAMFRELSDLWCTDLEFLNIRCGDWEEHAILLCNYFNYIDRYRREKVEGYGNTDIQSYCVQCDVVPEGEITMVLRRDNETGNCEFWNAVSGDCHYLGQSDASKQGICGRCCTGPDSDDFSDEGELRQDSPGSRKRKKKKRLALGIKPANPIQRVHIAFNAENVWANLKKQTSKGNRAAKVRASDFDFADKNVWSRLFTQGRDDHILRSTAVGLAASVSDIDLQTDYRLPDPSQALCYEAPNEILAAQIERDYEDKIEEQIKQYRSMGEHTGGHARHSTVFFRNSATRMAAILDDLELLSRCKRRCGDQAGPPLRSFKQLLVSEELLKDRLQEFEQEFLHWQKVRADTSGKQCSVYGVPFCQPYTDFDKIWEAILATQILQLGEDKAAYAHKVRVTPYASGVLSVWVFIACCTVI
jgi:hypothetical protein